jgi:tRNA A-37 threonylcarbamoyl transferase component Bud32
MSIFAQSQCVDKLVKMYINRNPDCFWIQRKKLGSGEQGEVFQVCCGRDDIECKNIVKISYPSKKKDVEQEVKMNILYEKLGVTTPLVEAFVCKDDQDRKQHFIVMEKRDLGIEEYIKYLLNSEKDENFILNVIANMMIQAILMVMFANKNRLVHNDLWTGNMMLNLGDDGFVFKDLVLIDFGKSFLADDEKQASRKEDIDDFKLTFKKILKPVIQNFYTDPNLDYFQNMDKIDEETDKKFYMILDYVDKVINSQKNTLQKVLTDEDYKILEEEKESFEVKKGMFDDEMKLDYNSPVGTPIGSPVKSKLGKKIPQAPKKFKIGIKNYF